MTKPTPQDEYSAFIRRMADAAARFQHSHIIPVSEVGEFEGQGFLVLEYAPGGTLQQKLGGTPQAPRSAAQPIEPLARAARGIIHRDLKPANVVLTEAASVLQWKVAVDRTLLEEEGLDALQLLRTVPMTVPATESLLEDAFRHGVRYRRPVYDSLYLVLAMAVGAGS